MTAIGLLVDLALLVGVAIPVVALAHRLKAPPIVGFLAAGILLGPSGLSLIEAAEEVEALAELGVALLLFAVGLELSLSHVREWARAVLVGGGVQVVSTLLIVAGIAAALGIPLAQAAFYGALAAMSSTAIVTKNYADRGELDSAQGRSVISILLFQDLCVLPLILLVPVFAGIGGADLSGVGRDFVLGLAIMAALLVGGRFLAQRVLNRIVLLRDRELFTLCVGFFGIGAAVVTEMAGFSIAIGAFIAGLIVSESEYGLQALSDFLPFRALFSSIFFISVGMLLDLEAALAHAWVLVPLLGGVLLLKGVLVTGAVLVVGASLRNALVSGISLAQVGEFSLILAAAGLPLGLFREGDYQIFLSIAVLSMMATPFLIRSAEPAARKLAAAVGGLRRGPEVSSAEGLSDHTVVVGYGISGRYLARMLDAAGIRCLVVEHDARRVWRAREDGLLAQFGDGTHEAVLEHARMGHARAVVFTIPSPNEARRAVAAARDLNPAVRIIARSRLASRVEELITLGAEEVVVEEFEASIELFAKALEIYRIPVHRIWEETEAVRTEHYGMLRGTAAPNLRLDAVKDLGIHDALELVEIADGARVIGLDAASLELRTRTGAVQIAVVRDGRPIYRPDPEYHYRAGDTVVLVGDRESLDRAISLFRDVGSDR